MGPRAKGMVILGRGGPFCSNDGDGDSDGGDGDGGALGPLTFFFFF